jgi:transcriptional regulator with XRE-family HTH domain
MKIVEYCIMAVNKEFLKTLGKRIDGLRKEKGLSFQELAIRSEMEKANLVKLTTHGKNITVNTLYNIAKGLDVELKDIFDLPAEK